MNNYTKFINPVAWIVFSFCFFGIVSFATEEQPNVLLIQVDDMGHDDLGLHGNLIIDTPSLDQLGRESVRFEEFYVSSVCAPTRAALLTGRNFLRTGVSGVHGGRDYMRLDETIIAKPLKEAGYVTGMWGKWHSGKTNGYFPWDRGFDEAYYACLYNYWDNTGLLNGKEVQTKGYATDAQTELAIDFLKRQTKSKQPFFAYVSYLAPHNPWRAPEKAIQKYRDRGLSDAFATLCGMIDVLDQNIGRLLQAVEDYGFEDNTIVVFISDNGPWVKSYRFGLNEEEWKLRNPNHFKGRKGLNWENGVRSPLFFRIPGRQAELIKGQVSAVEDLFPTILELCGVEIPRGLELDGRSLLPAIDGKKMEERSIVIASGASIVDEIPSSRDVGIAFLNRWRPLVQFEQQRLALRDGDWKLVRNEDPENPVELYHLATDPTESTNLAECNPEQTRMLTDKLKKWYQGVLDSNSPYEMPVFQIGFENRGFNQIYAVAPFDASDDLVLGDHEISNWNRVGQSTAYNINVQTPGKYEVALMTETTSPEQFRFSVNVGNEKVSADLGDDLESRPIGTLIRNESAYWENFDLKETFRKSIRNQVVGVLDLKKGPQRLHVALDSIYEKTDTQGSVDVIAIQLRRLKQGTCN